MPEKAIARAKIAGTYRVRQPMLNFKIRLRIVQQRSPLAELFESEEETRDANFLEAEEAVFSWQQKTFSPSEIKFYSEPKNCATQQQEDYHRQITEHGLQGSPLFTYTNHDSYHPDNCLLTQCYQSPLSSRNALALPALRNRKPFDERYNKKVIEDEPSDARIRTNHYLYRDREVMYILADLTPRDVAQNNYGASETLLCSVAFDKARKLLTVDPDFSHGGFYSVDGTGMSYDYWIEHASEEPSQEQLCRETEDSQRETVQRLSLLQSEIPQAVELPPVNTLRVFLTLDVVSAQNFSHDALFVKYFLDLPKYWSTTRPECLAGRTQRCMKKNGSANFGYVAELCLDLDLSCLEEERVLPPWPQLIISAASLDSWTRYRIEGYAAQPLPLSPGAYEFVLHTWRPVTGLINSLRRFFTGGTQELEDPTYSGVPSSHEGPKLEKPNLKTTPSGQVVLRINVAHQSRAFTEKEHFERDTFARLSASVLMTSVNSVLQQFKAARERMIRARATNS